MRKLSVAYWFCVLTIVIMQQCVFASTVKDSLRNLIAHDKEDTLIVLHLSKLTWEYVKECKPDSALEIANRSVSIAEKINYLYGLSEANRNLGRIYMDKNEYKQALEFYFDALKYAEKSGNKLLLAKTYEKIGQFFWQIENYSKSLEYYKLGLKESVSQKNKLLEMNCLDGIGISYGSIDSLELCELYIKRAYSIAIDNHILEEQINCLTNLAGIKQNQNKYEEAIGLYRKVLMLSDENNIDAQNPIVLINLGSLYLKKDDLKNSEQYMLRAYELSKKDNNISYQEYIAKYLVGLYKTKKNFTKAIEYCELVFLLKDSISNLNENKVTENFESKIKLIKEAAKLQAEKEYEQKIAEERNKKQGLIILIVSIGLIVTVLLMFGIYRRWKITQKQKQIIEFQKTEVDAQKHVIEEKNKEITDSINYAQLIQKSMLPHRRDIWAAFPNSFVLFKPKDIVSGDFYFFHSINIHCHIIAAADCTGHGVPGGFMTMLGSERLMDAVKQSSSPSEILSLLNRGVKKSLKQTNADSHSRDGMDIALCVVDTKSKTIHYSGANRPIWLLRKDASEIEEIKATKRAIGGFTENEQLFEEHTLVLNEGDSFYLSTDGYGDMFGDTGKKLTTKQFKQLLIENRRKSMKDQGIALDEFASSWKGKTEQIDDVLVIGIKL